LALILAAGLPIMVSACVTAPQTSGTRNQGGDLGYALLARLESGSQAASGSVTPGEASMAVQRLLMSDRPSPSAPDSAAPPGHDSTVLTFYDTRAFAPAWTDSAGLTARGLAVRDVLRTAWADGLTGVTVPPAPQQAGASLSSEAIARHDIALTRALADYVSRAVSRRPAWAPLIAGGLDGALRNIAAEAPNASRPGRLFRLLSEDDRSARLRRSLLDYQTLAEAGGWPTVNVNGPKIEPGSRHPDILDVRARLRATGDLPNRSNATPVPDLDVLDPTLVAAVQIFQARHGLAVDGKIGPQTRAAMAVPADQRVRQMTLNLRRLREMPPTPGGRSVEVNIAGAALEGRQDGVTVLRTDVIVGKKDRPTPELRSAINQIVLNPTWTVPTSIAQRDILPKLRNDPAYLISHGFQLFDGWTNAAAEIDPTTIDWHSPDVNIRAMRLRQAPGQGNALGEIKFLFPNSHDVYLHSTPSRGLFAHSTRTFSSGCVRVRDPLDLAAFLMSDPGTWTAESLKRQIARGGTRTLQPAQSVPLSIVYLTAWVEENGTVQFRRDLYDTDVRALAALPTPN